jgi:hypothetical protein
MSDKTKQGHPTQGTLDWLELIELNARLMGKMRTSESYSSNKYHQELPIGARTHRST